MALLKIVKSFLERDIQAVYVLSLLLPCSNSKSASYADLLLHFLNPKKFRIFSSLQRNFNYFSYHTCGKKKVRKPFCCRVNDKSLLLSALSGLLAYK